MKIRVYYEDTDTGGVVYHSNYLNFCERARSEVFFTKNITPFLESGHFVARRVVGDFYSSAQLGDLLEIKSELVEMRAASFSLKQSIFRGEEKIFELSILLAFISFEGKAQKMNTEVKTLIQTLFK
ncbi:YbgC/FadM family acyl-CoA thioesterase [Sulfurimonas aquatica]|uniref:YbgC/FadM family acyl-CoA thioesterase n=1 Tax=Sulfurimonas aquatica TaxID=2672570 RepID=A0A975B0C4_9BACT|nr:YbgC/FadM family acyl-CoA thioesterase [Sulfurimonas aquatica]QSZ41897.1 YbgC/FadM family acyl-CoA thioesterase [Sulfurimonas aquatica]